MSRVFLPLLLLAVLSLVFLGLRRWWQWVVGEVERRNAKAQRELVQVRLDLEAEKARSLRLQVVEDNLISDIKLALIWDAEGVPFLTESVRAKAEALVNKYDEEKGRH